MENCKTIQRLQDRLYSMTGKSADSIMKELQRQFEEYKKEREHEEL